MLDKVRGPVSLKIIHYIVECNTCPCQCQATFSAHDRRCVWHDIYSQRWLSCCCWY